ncbi:hypothetical protein EGM51_05970 [Verrucomicrobia bacterium S94]|nr:hypothetical protein EGM51_05970 [Verrucomicrobia bacterium S94]
MSAYDERPMTTGSWFLTLLVLSIPVVNVICLIIWACGAGNRSRVTYCRATILWVLLAGALYFIFFVLAAGSAAF